MESSDVPVLPINDLREHETARTCWCQPRCEQEDPEGGVVVIHQSADGRELVERDGVM